MLRNLVGLAFLLTALPAAAQTAPPSPNNSGREAARGRFAHVREVCQADFQQYCASAGQERGARRECIRANAAKFSQPCRDALAEMRAWRQSHRGGWRGQAGGAPGSDDPH